MTPPSTADGRRRRSGEVGILPGIIHSADPGDTRAADDLVWEYEVWEHEGSTVDGEPATSRYLATRRRILEVAAVALRDKGYYGARLVDIAAAAEMRTTSLYYYFAAKDDLVAEVFRIGITTTRAHVEKLLDDLGDRADPLDRLSAMIRGHLHVTLGAGAFATAVTRVLGQAPASVHADYMVHQRAYAALWRRELDEAVRRGAIRADLDASAIRMLVTGALNWDTEWYVPGGALSVEELADAATGMIIDGVRNQPPDLAPAGTTD